MSLYRYRVFKPGQLTKPERIEDSPAKVEIPIPRGEERIVHRYQGRSKLAAYRVDRDIRGGVRWTQIRNG